MTLSSHSYQHKFQLPQLPKTTILNYCRSQSEPKRQPDKGKRPLKLMTD